MRTRSKDLLCEQSGKRTNQMIEGPEKTTRRG
jgi:hypothetical protein